MTRQGEWLECRADGVCMEADPWHTELILKEMDMENCKGSLVVGRVDPEEDEGGELNPREASKFRSITARCNFLATDRIDIHYGCKEICRKMSSPQRDDWKLLKRMARNLRSRPRMLLHFKHQERPSHLTVAVDTDFAGCRRTRKSTNGGYIMHGGHIT